MKSHNSGSTYIVTLTTTPTVIKQKDIEPRITLSLHNGSGVTIYYGFDNGMTTATGFPLENNGKANITGHHGIVYGVVATSTADIRVLTY